MEWVHKGHETYFCFVQKAMSSLTHAHINSLLNFVLEHRPCLYTLQDQGLGRCFGLSYHYNADDIQLYISFSLSPDSTVLLLSQCLIKTSFGVER